MAFYECTFIVRQDVTTQEVQKITDSYISIVNANEGKALKIENWGLRNLAYEIKKNKKGHYVMMVLEATGVTIKELERRFKLSEDVIRFLTIRIDSFDGKDSIILSSANE
jgi:small subunit ribosomal protein S6